MLRRTTILIGAALLGLIAADARAGEANSPFRTFGRSRRTVVTRRYYNPFQVVVLSRLAANPFGLPTPAVSEALTAQLAAEATAVDASAAAIAPTEVAVEQPVSLSETPTFRSESSTSAAVIIAPPPYRPPPRSPYRPAPRPPF